MKFSFGTGDTAGYALSLPFRSCTEEQIAKLRAEVAALAAQLEALRGKTPRDLWSEELDHLEAAYATYRKLRQERQGEERASAAAPEPKRRRKAKA